MNESNELLEQNTILKIRHYETPFVQIDKRMFDDYRLHWKTKGVLGYLLGKPNGWIVRIGDIEKKSQDGKHAVRSALAELIEVGYATRTQERGPDGQFVNVVYTISERPEGGFPTDENAPHRENHQAAPHLGNRDTGKPLAENRDVSNKDSSNKDSSNNLTPLTHDDFYEAPPREKLTLDERKGRIAAAIANNAARGEASSWAVPAQAGGSDEVGEALLPIFCDGVGVAVHALPEKKAASWRKALREVADRWGATVEEATTALGGLMAEDGEFAWKTYSTPFQTGFQSDFELMLGRVRSGRPMESKRGQSGSRKDPAFDDGANPYGALTPEEWEQYPLIGDR